MSGLVPTLRFPEFNDGWGSNTLKDVAKFSKGKGISKSDIIENGMTPCIRYGELYTTYNTTIDDVISFTNVDPSNLILSKGNEVIVPASGEDAKDIATASVVKRSGIALGSDLNIIHSKNDGYFLASYLSGKKRLFLASLAQGNSVVHLYPSQLGALHINIPSLFEQQKIADFLSSVDAKIDAVDRKLDAFERYKKGLMQQIFSQKIRFKQDDGSDFPAWEEKRLGDVYSWIKTNSLSREYLTDEINKIQNIHYGDIHTKFKTMFHQEKETIPYILPSAPMRQISNEEFCQIGDVIIADASEDYKDIGKSIEIISVQKNSLVAGLHTYIARPNKKTIAIGFSGYLFANHQTRKQIMRIAQGISVLGVSKTNVAGLKLNLPSLPEQQKIADFLSSIDAKIDAIKTQIEKLEAFKKGLLQQMFV